MVAYNFQPQFEADIRAGVKRSTMRGARKRHVGVGERFNLYVGQRSKDCRRLGVATCATLSPVRLNLKHGLADVQMARLGWQAMNVDILAHGEGFRDFNELADFWLKHHREAWSWEGWLIEWGRSFVGTPQ